MRRRENPKDRYARALRVYQETSRDAWESFEAHIGAVDARILGVIREFGATSDEVEAVTGLKHQTVSAQIRHMAEAGLLVKSGVTRPTRSGRSAIVWVLVPKEEPELTGRLF